jgi:uncharacterized protein involved in exopolysaccharide biosynthesis/Mrp family chromosome partitioning ATPase
MQTNDSQNPPVGIQINDIYYVLFRRKWLVLSFALVGFVTAGVIYKVQPDAYESRARLLVPYIFETRGFVSVSPGSGDIQKADSQGEGIIDSEVQILTSSDLAADVVKSVGAERILGNRPGFKGDTASAAAGEVSTKLSVNPSKKGAVIFVNFQHPNPEVAREVLIHLIDAYRRKHVEIHRTLGEMDEFLDRKTGDLRTQVAVLEEDLRALKSTNGIVSLEDTKKAQLDQISRLQNDLYLEEAKLAEMLAAFPQITNQPLATNMVGTNAIAGAGSITVPGPVPEAKIIEYRRLLGQLEYFSRREQELLTTFSEENLQVRAIQKKITEIQEAKARLEKEEPGLVKEEPVIAGRGSLDMPLKTDYRAETLRVAGIQAKIGVLRRQLDGVKTSAAAVEVVENQIRDKTRRKDAIEEQYKMYSKRLEEARVERAVDAAKLTSIRVIQAPTAAGKELTKLYKRMGAAAGGGIGIGLALAFFLELFLDQSVRRVSDLQKKLRLPVFVSVPRFKRLREKLALPGGGNGPAGSEVNGGASLLPALHSISANSSIVQTYCDALRDRLIHYFQKNNMTHKPKLVAVTGCGEGVGVSTIAAGLAASLSETGDGNVLLVDTNVTEGAAHPFYRGKLVCGLNEVLKEDSRGQAQVQDNLFVAAANDSDGELIKALPKRFTQLVPKLKASDYDYIIFDLPPVSQTSITSKLAGFMDMVLLVVESEKTGRSIVTDATDLLRDSRATVATVLNKTRRYVPEWVHRDFE